MAYAYPGFYSEGGSRGGAGPGGVGDESPPVGFRAKPR